MLSRASNKRLTEQSRFFPVPCTLYRLSTIMSDLGATGDGPRSRLLFNGDEEKYELWEVKFIGHLRLQKLHDVLTATTPDAEKNARVYAELVQLLDDTSLSLVMREAKDNGQKAMRILREYYMGTSKPRIISLYAELTSLKMEEC